MLQQLVGDFAGHAVGLVAQVGNLKSVLSDTLLRREPNGEENLYSKVQSSPMDDLGYTVAVKVSKRVEYMCASLNYGEPVAPHYGVDWNTLYGVSSSRSSGESIDVILQILQEARPPTYQMKDHATSSPSREALSILSGAIEVHPINQISVISHETTLMVM